MDKNFQLIAPYQPTGDQPQAIRKLNTGLNQNMLSQTLLGATGTGKTFVMANLIAQQNQPALVIAHNKTLAAQLASEFRTFFPHNAVHYFVSYYDYYQPEAYIPRTDTYIEKETQLNEEIDRLRHAATESLLSRKDVIVVASVSCIYGLGSPEVYQWNTVKLQVGEKYQRDQLFRKLIKMQYQRNDLNFMRGTFRVRGDILEIFPASSDGSAFRFDFFGNELEKILEIEALTGKTINTWPELTVFPATHYVARDTNLKAILKQIAGDLQKRVAQLKANNKLVEAQRLEQRTRFDLEMIEQVGYVNGIENYSRYFDERRTGEPPYTLLDYFPPEALTFIDESHITIPQIRGMYAGDRARKQMLIDYGFRLPAALDNRPLNFPEFEKRIHRAIYVSATPQNYEMEKSQPQATPSGQVVELLIRPTGLLDPKITLKPTVNQIDDLLARVQERITKHHRVLVTTLTKRLAEELTDYLREADIKVQYLHSEVDTMERLEILRDLRLGVYDVVVGINLLREGLDLPEVSLVTILDADKEGFLRSKTSLIQTIGRAARHEQGEVVMYADKITDSMQAAISETQRRRKIQEAYNKKHHITPRGIRKKIKDDRLSGAKQTSETTDFQLENAKKLNAKELQEHLKDLHNKMELAAKNLEFETAAQLRDEINSLQKIKPKTH